MSNPDKTIADIVAEMRAIAENAESSSLSSAWQGGVSAATVARLADDIEAAVKRERERVEAEALTVGGMVEAARKPVGNAAALREALEAIDKNTDLLDIAEDVAPNLHPSHSFVAVQIRKIVRAALEKPARNCDVGTADEQENRFEKFCDSHKWLDDEGFCSCSSDCPLYKTKKCTFHWAQMPYKEGGAK